MASVVADTLRLTFKLLLSKMRDTGAENLKHGDVSDERFRDFIVRELTAIREKLEGLCKMDLISSANFFKDGVSLMYHSFAKSGKGGPSIKTEVLTFKSDFDDVSLFNTDATNIELDEWEVLHLMSDGLQFDKIDSEDKFFIEAKDFLKKAAESATKAFSNESLDIYDRVLSMKFRVAATMLEFIAEPEVAVVLCKNYLEQLNSLPEVRRVFSVRFGSFNLRKLFCEMKREALISAVMSINRILWEYLHLCSKGDEFLRNWPEIPVDSSHKIHPVLSREVCKGYKFWSFGEFGADPAQLNGPVDIATNSKGDFLVADRYNFQIKMFSRDGTLSERVCELALLQTFNEDTVVTNLLHPQCIDVDKNDRVYIGSSYKCYINLQFTNEIIVVDKNGNFCWSFGRGLPSFNKGQLTSLAVDRNRDRIFALCEKTVFVLNTDGTFLSCFTFTGEFTQAQESHMCVTTRGDLIVTALNAVFVISKRAANDASLKSRTILPCLFIKPHRKIPSNFTPSGITFNPHTEEVVVVDRASNALIAFDPVGNFKRKVYFYEKYASGGATITRDGHVAVASKSTNKVLVL